MLAQTLESKEYGADIVAYDMKENRQGCGFWSYWNTWPSAAKVIKEDAKSAVARHPTRTLLMVWPNAGLYSVDEVIRRYRGNTIILVVERLDALDTKLAPMWGLLDREWTVTWGAPVQSHPHTKDCMWILQRLVPLVSAEADAVIAPTTTKPPATLPLPPTPSIANIRVPPASTPLTELVVFLAKLGVQLIDG